MPATTATAVRGAESGYRNRSWRCLVERTFIGIRTNHFGYRHARRSEQIVDMPTQGFLVAKMPRNAGFEISFGRAGVDVFTRCKIEPTKVANLQAQGLAEVDVKLVGTRQEGAGGVAWFNFNHPRLSRWVALRRG